ncbi:hypothetical protein BJY52DRAFT_1194722, partial [Lactarius psammicola]
MQEGTKFGDYEKAELRERKKAAELGYMAMNLVEPPEGAFWGRYNDRKVDTDWVSSLTESFLGCLENCTDSTAIEVAVKKDWLVDANLIVPSVEGKKIENIAKIEFTEKGKKEIGKNNLWVLGGNHRREALIKHVRVKQKELEKVKRQAEKKEAQGGEEDQELDGLKRAAKQLEEEFETASMWAIRLYDRETIEANEKELSTAIYRFLSRNETKDTHMATEEELLIEVVDELKDAYEIDLAKRGDRARNLDAAALYPTFMNKAKEKAALFKDSRASVGHRRLCSVPSFALGLVMASRIRRHYTHALWFNVQTLTTMLDSHGAFISEFLVESLEVLERVANPNKPPMVLATIEPLATKLLGTSSDMTAIKQELSHMAEAFEGKGDSSTWTQDLLEKIDQCFLDNYYDSKVLCDSIFFPKNSDNHNRFTKYCSDVDNVLQNETETAPPYAREYFAYAMMWKLHGYEFPMPLGTASVVEALHILAEKYTKGLGEVISWLGTGLYWVPKMGSKVYIVYDPFDAALNIVSKDLLIKRNATGVRRRIFRVILNHLTTSIVEIDVYLMNNPTPRTLIEDLSPFKSISTVAKDKGKGKATKNKTKSDALSPSTKEPVAMSEFLSAVNWTADRLKKEYDTIREMMSKHQFTRDNRLSNHRGTRLLTMCGLPWNPESQNKPRDFAMIATAVSVESAVVNTYRENLLGLCPGARALRKDLHSLFIEFAVPHSIQNDAGDDIIHCIWEFPDSISSDESADRHKPYNLKVLLD